MYHEVQRELGGPILHGYGMTECPMIAQGAPHDTDEQLATPTARRSRRRGAHRRRATARCAGPATRARSGVRARWSFGLHRRRRSTAEAFDADGFFRTGDLGHLRADGHVALTGRLKDVIIRKGENISAEEIEDLLLQPPEGRATSR